MTLPGRDGFVAGTLVHAKQGFVPIESIAAGDLVLSQPDTHGEPAYKRVVSVVAHDEEVCLFEYVVSSEKVARSVVVTAGHLFFAEGFGWIAAGQLAGETLELVNGVDGFVFQCRRIFMTAIPDVGWTRNDRTLVGPTIDLRNGKVEVSKTFEEDSGNPAPLDEEEVLRRRVFGIEVEDYHTYYVGEAGVWVHDNKGAPPLGAVTEEDSR